MTLPNWVNCLRLPHWVNCPCDSAAQPFHLPLLWRCQGCSRAEPQAQATSATTAGDQDDNEDGEDEEGGEGYQQRRSSATPGARAAQDGSVPGGDPGVPVQAAGNLIMPCRGQRLVLCCSRGSIPLGHKCCSEDVKQPCGLVDVVQQLWLC